MLFQPVKEKCRKSVEKMQKERSAVENLRIR